MLAPTPPRSSGPRSAREETPGPDGVYDAVIVGSGFGGAMVARAPVRAGQRVLMLERGDWVERGPGNWDPDATVELTRHFDRDAPYRLSERDSGRPVGLYSCVGGPSVFYGGVSLRFREADFRPRPEIVGDSGAEWPLAYEDLRPWYREAERILDVAGEAGVDPTEPARSGDYPQSPPPLAAVSRTIAEAAGRLGLSPFHLPLAINYRLNGRRPAAIGREACIRCTTCDTFACAVAAKNDLATAVLPDLLRRGLDLRPMTEAVGLETEGRRVSAVRCVDRRSGRSLRVRGRRVVLSAGALASPHLLLASGLAAANPGGDAIGRYLMRHRNLIVFGVFPGPPDPVGEFHKQLGIHDFYFGDGRRRRPRHKLGAIQQVQTPPLELVKANLPAALDYFIHPRVDWSTGLLVMAEDQPRRTNRVRLDPRRRDPHGRPPAVIEHRYTRRDLAAGRALVREAKRILREAGALVFYVHGIETFSHAVGTVRMGPDPARSALDAWCRFRGIENLWVVDGSFMPTSAGLNPSLTIAANALRVGDRLAREAP